MVELCKDDFQEGRMPRLYQVRDLLSDVLGMHQMTMDRHIGKLRDAGVLPANTAATIDAEHTARMLIALLASRVPTETVDALNAFESLELLVVERREQVDDGLVVRETQITSAVDIPDDVGCAEWFTLPGALTLALESGRVIELTACRNLSAPVAIITATAKDGQPIRLLYGQRLPPSGLFAAFTAIAHGKLNVWASLPREGIEPITALLAGRPPVPAVEGQPAPVFH